MLLVAVNGFLCIAALAFPFSVAATNVGLGVALGIGILSGFWWQGAKRLWHEFRPLGIAFVAYFTLLLTGLLWSQNIDWGIHILGRHWFWFLVPIMLVSLSDEKWRRYFLISLSVGLALHLLFCVLQFLGYVHLTSVAGSGDDNATGHIGHIGFGVVYGIWAAWLLFMGLRSAGRWCWLFWGLSLWSYIMIFIARGRSGYIVAFALAISVIIKWYADRIGWRRMTLIIGIMFVFITTALALGPASERLQGTWLAMTGNQQDTGSLWKDNGRDALTQRFQMWKTTLDIYRMHPVLGVGTGGLPDAVVMLNAENRAISTFNFVHPHNQYLLALVRWGPTGVILLSLLLFYWMREGWRSDWHTSIAAPLLFLPPLALAIHGLSSTAIEEHFSAILAAMLLGVALSDNRFHAD